MSNVKECKITKRNGFQVSYDRAKIERAIGLAMGETNESLEWGKYEEMLDYIESKIACSGDGMTVEDVSDVVQRAMMKFDLCDSAERYIIWRRERTEARGKEKYGILSKEFLSKYKHLNPPFSAMGGFVYARTYAKWIPEKGRREYWHESVRRMVEFSCSIVPTSVQEAEKLFDNIFNLKQNLSGRMAFVGGSETSREHPLSLFNCAFLDAKEFRDFGEIFYLLMLGAGMGVRITKDVVSQLPKVRTNVEIIHKHREPVDKKERQQYTTTNHLHENMIEVMIGDSRESWRDALDLYFKIISDVSYRGIDTILFNYDNIREKGERLKRFGGKSGGYKPLMRMFEKISKMIYNKKNEKIKLTTMNVGDIATIIGENVVAGNIRRTAIILICDPDDYEVVNAKSNLYVQSNGKWEINKSIIHRQMSNNTVVYATKPSYELFSENFNKMKVSAEPGFYVLENALKRNKNARGLNPCGIEFCLK